MSLPSRKYCRSSGGVGTAEDERIGFQRPPSADRQGQVLQAEKGGAKQSGDTPHRFRGGILKQLSSRRLACEKHLRDSNHRVKKTGTLIGKDTGAGKGH
ncbi:hypothetical protein Q8A67_011514 [Cirrhinus molitorella]|uniref:Uncharacterized protein n=1 Tax=Cirrhinus molitorella TaxID=172907 RepID=A0AA88PN69_9TELE|nr:hypothetical protein Q8A67_011514 [Cirrhinus molitorella]